jgi:tartrate-resistant acid phosphatase type 5
MTAHKNLHVKLRWGGILLFVGSAVLSVALSASGPQTSFLIISDWGYLAAGNPEQQNTARALADYALKSGISFAAVLVGGDNFKEKLAGPNDPNFRKAFEDMYDVKALHIPFYTIFGSHDYEYGGEAAELEYGLRHPDSRWKMPARWYRLDLPTAAPLVTVLMLDSNQDMLTKEQWQAQIRWMDQELAKPRKAPWTICFGHHPLFSDGRHGDSAEMQAAWGAMLKKYRIDFYICGHDHVLQHLQVPGWPTTFLISGGGGENTNRPVPGNRGPFVRAAHGFASMQFDALTAKVSLIDDKCAILHTFERDRNGAIRVLNTTPSSKPSK